MESPPLAENKICLQGEGYPFVELGLVFQLGPWFLLASHKTFPQMVSNYRRGVSWVPGLLSEVLLLWDGHKSLLRFNIIYDKLCFRNPYGITKYIFEPAFTLCFQVIFCAVDFGSFSSELSIILFGCCRFVKLPVKESAVLMIDFLRSFSLQNNCVLWPLGEFTCK